VNEQFGPIQELLDRVRARWRRLVFLEVTTRAAAGGAVVIALALGLSFGLSRSPFGLAALGVLGIVAAVSALVWAAWPARHVPSDRKVARFIEERHASLDERLVSAVDVFYGRDADERPALADAMIRDAAKAAAEVDAAVVVPADAIRRRGLRAALAFAALVGMLFLARHAARQAFDAVALMLFPSHIALDVTPGNARVQAGSTMTVEARLVGNSSPVVAQLLRAPAGSEEWQPAEMETDGHGHFRLALSSLSASFRYKVLAGSAASAAFDVAVVRPPRGAHVDVASSGRELDRVRKQVEDDLTNAALVPFHGIDLVIRGELDAHALDARAFAHHHDAALEGVAQRERRDLELGLAGLDLREIQHVVDE